jgi:hypothetical protein
MASPLLAAQAPTVEPPKLQIRGTVVDEQDKPVAGATVDAVAVRTLDQGADMTPVKEHTTDDRGAFTLEVPYRAKAPGLVVRLRARYKDAFTARPLELRGAALDQPVTLKVSPKNARALSVRARDEAGKPIPGVAVTASYRRLLPAPFGHGTPRLVDRPEPAAWVTGAEGRFESPRSLAPDVAFQLELKAEGFLPEKTAWKEMAATDPLAFGDVVLLRLRPLEGRVLDRQDQPVAGARVLQTDSRQRAEATTDADGRFQLSITFVPPSLLFVEKAGFRFHGQRCDRPEPFTIPLTRRDEPAEKRMTTLPPALPRAERKELAARLLEPYLRGVLEKADDDSRLRPLATLAKLDAGRLLEELEKRPYQNAWYDAYLRRAAVKTLLAESFEEARAVVDSMKHAGFRSTGYLDLCDALPAGKRTDKLALLDQALLHSRGMKANDHRAIQLGSIAKRLWALGEKERATKLLREGQAIARELPTAALPGYVRGAFAGDLALIDLPAALALIKDLQDPYEYVRHHGSLAHKLAGTQPAEAERVFGILLKPSDRTQVLNRDQYAIRICHRMAPADLPRARKIAETIQHPDYKPQAYSVMAQALARREPQEARGLLDRAFDLLAGLVASGEGQFNNFYDPAALAGSMVPIAEQIDTALVPEFFWRALALRSPAAIEDRPGMMTHSLGALALTVARYDRDLTGAFIAEAQKHRREDDFARANHFLAAALVDPRWAVALIEGLPDGPGKDHARQSVIDVLLGEGDAVWRAVHRALALWYVDDED